MRASVVAIDETEYWDLNQIPHSNFIERILGVYIYDADLVTYVCSAQPMREVYLLRTVAILHDRALRDEAYDFIVDEIDEAVDEASAHDPLVDYICTIHADSIEDRFDDDSDYESIEDAIDWHMANHFVA